MKTLPILRVSSSSWVQSHPNSRLSRFLRNHSTLGTMGCMTREWVQGPRKGVFEKEKIANVEEVGLVCGLNEKGVCGAKMVNRREVEDVVVLLQSSLRTPSFSSCRDVALVCALRPWSTRGQLFCKWWVNYFLFILHMFAHLWTCFAHLIKIFAIYLMLSCWTIWRDSTPKQNTWLC